MTVEQSTLNQDATQAAPAAQPAPQTSTDTASSGQSQSAKLLTQSEVDFQLGERAKRATEAAQKKILSELGLTSVDEIATLKQVIEDARKRKEADMSESDKAKAELERERKAKSELEQQLNAERAERRNDRIETELRAALTAAKANNPKTVLSYILVNHRDAMQSLLTDDGKIDEKAMTALVETVKKEDVTLFTPPPSIPGSRSNLEGHYRPQNQAVKIDMSRTSKL